MEATQTTLSVAGRRVEEIRGGSGRPLLYLHSAMGEATWMPHLTRLAERYELHAPAHPGFLGSDGLDSITGVIDLVHHYLSYMDELGWDSVDVVGLSLGGWIAAEIAARYPERVRKLALVSSVGIWLPDRPIADIFALDSRFPERLPKLLFHDTDNPVAQMMAQPFEEVPDEVLAEVMKGLAATARIGWNPLLHDPALESLLGRVSAKTLCLWGDDDRVVATDYGRRFAELIPDAELVVVPECGHMLPFEKEETFITELTSFFG